MATEKEASLQSCASDPNFAVICSFLDQFATQCGISHPTFKELQDMLEDTQEVSQVLIDMHIKLLRKARKSFTADKWEKALAKFCHTYSQQDGWELERFGYKKARLGVKVKLLKVLLETQFDVNGKFKTEVNKVVAKDLRLEPLGRDQNGFQYWCQFDKSSHVRIYREDLDDETWEMVASDRNGLVELIDSLSNGEGQQELNSILNEDSTSQEIEKPITDTGQEDIELEDGEEVEDEEVEEEVECEEELEEEEDHEEAEESESIELNSKTLNSNQIEEISVPKNVNEDKLVTVTSEVTNNEHVGLTHSVETNVPLTGVDLSIKSESKRYAANDYYPSVPDRPYIPERNDILSQMSARFNEIREAEDLSINQVKKVKLDNIQPMMLVKKDIVVSEPIEEPIGYITGPGSGQDCEQGNIDEEPEFSEVIEEPVQYIVGIGSGVECEIGNPRLYDKSEPSSSYSASTLGIESSLKSLSLASHEPNFSDVIEEPVMFVRGFGYGHDCLTGNPDEIDESLDDKSPEKKPKLWSIDTICSSQKLLPESMKQDSAGSSQKDPEVYDGPSNTSEDNGHVKSPVLNDLEEDNCSDSNISNSSNGNLKPSSDVKPILENIPMKDKPPDSCPSDSSSVIAEIDSEANSLHSSYELLLRDRVSMRDESSPINEANQISNTDSNLSIVEFDPDQTKSSEGAQTSDDISSDDKLTIDDQNSTDPLVIDKSSVMPTSSESEVKSFSEENSRNSIISEEFTRSKSMALSIGDRENSNMSVDCLESHSSSNLLSIEEREKSDCSDGDMERTGQKKPKKPFVVLSRVELDIESRSVNSDKPNSKRSKCSISSKNSNTSCSSNKSKSIDDQINYEETNKSQTVKIGKSTENAKIGSSIKERLNNISVTGLENGSNLLAVGNCSVVCEKFTDISSTNQSLTPNKNSKLASMNAKSLTDSLSETVDLPLTGKHKNDELENPSAGNNSVTSDEKRKNVMLTNIIEVCLDNDTKSKDGCKSELKGQLNAKFNDLFSAKNLLEPTVKDSSEEKVSTSMVKISDKCTGYSSSEEKLKTDEEYNKDEIKSEEECSNKIKMEKDSGLEDIPITSTSNAETESDIKHENDDSIKLEETKEDKSLKNPIRGRKSRANSLLNNDEEIDIPNKVRKTANVQVRRISRRNTRSASQTDVSLDPEDETLEQPKGLKTRINNDLMQKSDMKRMEDEIGIKEPKTENEIDEKNKDEMEELAKNENKNENDDDIDESIKNEVDDISDKLKQMEGDGIEDSYKTSSNEAKENKGFTLSSFSLEPPIEEGPVLGKPPDFKALQNIKRKNSRKRSRSEEDGGEVEEGEEEAGCKKPRLRADKTHQSKATSSASHPQQPVDSSSEEDQSPVNLEVPPAKRKVKPRSRGRPQKRKGMLASPANSSTLKSNRKKKEQKSDERSDSENEDMKQSSGKKGTKKTKLSIRRESEKEERKPTKKLNEKEDKKQASVKKPKSQQNDKVKSKGLSKKDKKKSDKDEMREDSDSEIEESDNETSKEAKQCKSDEEEDEKSEEEVEEKPRPKKGRPKKKTLLGLMESDLIHSKTLNDSEGSRVRQSRRIAQIKIKEEAERRAIEEATMLSLKDIKKKSKEDKQSPKKHKKKKGKIEKASEEEDETFKEPNEEKKRGRKKKKKRGLKYDINKPWQSSSDSSSEEAEEEDEHYEEEEEEDIRASKVVSDHEFSPESDLEKDEEESLQPIRRARTAKKADQDHEEDKEEDGVEDYPCKKCGQPDHPEWILLCDKCDNGYHASCLRPTIMLIPEGDWFCPPCQHAELVSKLKETLRAFERNTKRRENEELRKKRLAYVGISLANVLPINQEKTAFAGGRRVRSESSESSSEESESSEEEPVYQLRQRRAALQANYRFNDYDELINSAIQDEMEAVKGAGNMGRGKDIANIVEAEKKSAEEGEAVEEEPKVEEEEEGENWRPPVVPKNTSLPSLRKKPKKLTDLDKQSEDDADSDEDFKGSSEEEEYSSYDGDSDDSLGRRQPVRRSSRTRVSRIDKEFINDDTESSDEPRKKKTRRIWASSSSESSDTTWGRRKKKAKTYSRIKSSRSGKKKKKFFDSDSDRPKKPKQKRPKIRYGLSEDDDEPIRRTRGKKMSYLEVAGSDTEEEVIARSRKLISEDEEEFVPEKEEADPDEDENEPEEVEPQDIEKEKTDEQQFGTGNVPVANENKVVEEVDKNETTVPDIESRESLEDQDKVIEDDDDDDDDDDQVEEEEIEEEVEEEVEEEEEEEEEYEDGPIEEAKNLVREKVEEPKGIIQPIKISAGASLSKVPIPSQLVTKPSPLPQPAVTVPTTVMKEEKKEEKEEKKEPTPAIRLVPSAKLLDPNKRRPPEEGVIRGMLAGGGYYRPQLMQAPGRQPFRQRYPDQQRYLYQPSSANHQFFPGSAFYSGEDYSVGGGYEEQIDPNISGGDEEGVFSGLVSYFSSQREDNLDS